MGIAACFIMPHPPLAVAGVGPDSDREAIAKTMQSFDKIAKEIAQIKPDTIIVSSPHAPMYADYFQISAGNGARGDFSAFLTPDVKIEKNYDLDLVENITRFCKDAYFPAGVDGTQNGELDHGTMVPLYFVEKYYRDYELVRIGLSGLPLEEHFRFGKFIKKVADVSEKKIVFIASGDLSHYQKDYGPYGYRPEGPLYDQELVEALIAQDLSALLEFDENLLTKAGECGHRSFCILAGLLADEDVYIRVLSHENTFGVGYALAQIQLIGEVEKKEQKTWDEILMQEMKRYYDTGADRLTYFMEAAIMEKQEQNPYVSLARRTINAHVLGEDLPDISGDLPKEMLENRAGTFVSIHKEGHLRGCIGTIIATKHSIAEEIRSNAIEASTHDPRFPMVSADELSLLEINVDVLTEPERITSESMLDPKRYGVIVENGGRLGLLLPDLEGVDTVERQISIAKRKAGIGEEEPVELMRFEVIRHK